MYTAFQVVLKSTETSAGGVRMHLAVVAAHNQKTNKQTKMKMKIHLSFTGHQAGTRLCGVSREDSPESVHAVYAPIHLDEYRSRCCDTCLDVYAECAYDPGDEMPDWVEARRH
jgi:hypothetical protein